jgi:uncharacterized protein YfdQ (DUF2303 family)
MTDQTSRETEAAVVADLAAHAQTPHELDPAKIHTIRDGARVVDLESYLERPRRKTGVYSPATVASLIDYVGEHSSAHTTLWVDKLASKVTAVINDHAESEPGWGDHRAVVQLQPSPEWKHWSSQDGQFLDQESFAEHLQDGIEEIRDPAAAIMLEVAESMQGATKADWKTATRLDNGEVSLAYHEQIEATAGRKAHLEIPQAFTLAVSPFYGEQPFALTARLRYRIREGSLRIGYRLNRPHDVVMAVLDGIAERLRREAGCPNVYLGAPPA